MQIEDSKFHTPVLLSEVIEYLDVRPKEKYIDATIGGAGHAVKIVKRGGKVLGIDQDPQALDVARTQLMQSALSQDFKLEQGSFRDIDKIAVRHGFTDVAGVFFDLGVSSFQLDWSGRGFSFRSDGLLDMRMNPKIKVTAADLTNGLRQDELEELLREYGEEPKARKIAEKIAQHRKSRQIATTRELRGIIEKVGGTGKTKARVWQALRIAVNDELNALKEALPKAVNLLKPGGRIVVISFHSLEDRIVKKEFRSQNLESRIRQLTQKPVRASEKEIRKNPRASSAKLRCAERIVE